MYDYTAGKPWKVAKRQRITEAAFRLFSQSGIEAVNMAQVADASGVSRATLFRYFPSKLDLVVAVGAQTWEDYIAAHNASLPVEVLEHMTAAKYMRFYLDSFIDLYRNHGNLLRFNYEFNSYLRHEDATQEQRQSYLTMLDGLRASFHELYARGERDGTLNTQISEESMLSSSFHIMLAAVTRYAVGLAYVSQGTDPESELVMLEELLLSRYVVSA